MNKSLIETKAFVSPFMSELSQAPPGESYQVVIAPPASHLAALGQSIGDAPLELGAQNCGPANFGAHTGEVAPPVLEELGCKWVILGHSERRHIYGESDELILKRLLAALETQNLNALLCVGETLEQRKQGKTLQTVGEQLSILTKTTLDSTQLNRITVAYEPVWAIGTGENATPEQAQEVHKAIRERLSEIDTSWAATVRLLYGGSVKPKNAAVLFKGADVDGFLVGGASLEPNPFAEVIANSLNSNA